MKADMFKGLGASKDAARMSRVVSFYEKLPRGSAAEVQPKGFLRKYQAKHFGKNATAMRMLALNICLEDKS